MIWDQYLSKDGKWTFGNMGSISYKKETEMERLYFHLKELKNDSLSISIEGQVFPTTGT